MAKRILSNTSTSDIYFYGYNDPNNPGIPGFQTVPPNKTDFEFDEFKYICLMFKAETNTEVDTGNAIVLNMFQVNNDHPDFTDRTIVVYHASYMAAGPGIDIDIKDPPTIFP